ncbi:MAG: hypothetical protein D6718_01285 [Acidobacteria bacterium]|nr:MAG: hypothetical protein D6718_01285 [Acidobacteriota bacterium]
MIPGRLHRIVAAFALVLAPAAARAAEAPSLTIHQDGPTTRIEVTWQENGTVRSATLRETRASVRPGRTGAAPDGSALFATWSEDGERWFSVARGEPLEWTASRRLETELRLRDGATRPDEPLPAPAPGFAADAASRLWLVQFETVSIPEWRSAVEAAGGRILAYFPHNAHLVRAGEAAVRAVARLPFVARIAPYHPWYRISREVREWLSGASPDDRLRVNVMAAEWGEPGKRRIVEAARRLGARIDAAWPNGHIVELTVTPSQLAAMARHDDVVWIDPWSAPETDMDLVREDAGTNWIENNLGYCGQGVHGEVMDAGIEDTHQDFDGIMLHGPHDTASHGTSTYGIVFGNGDRDGDGKAKATGHLPCAQGIFADYGNLGDRFAETQELKGPPYYASFQTNSWGSARTRSYNSKSHEMDDIIWRLDIAITQSQSNAGNQDSRPQAWAKNIISVGGIKHHDTLDTSDDNWGGGASIGPAEDGRIKPDVCYWYDHIYTTTTGNGYTSNFGGTSAATPEVAGALGILVQMWSEDVWNTHPTGTTVFERQPHFSTIKALLINTAQQYPFSGTSDDLTRMHQGWGRPDLVYAKQTADRSFIVDWGRPLGFNETASYDLDVAAGEAELRVTLVYPDPPGTTAATLHRINDLSLKVTSPSGTVYYGNHGLDVGTQSIHGGAPDTINTVENVFVRNPEPGIWTAEVTAAEINQDEYLDTPEADSVFSLVVTGATGSSCVKPTADFTITPNPARVGEAVLFDSTVSGGAGPPYSYAWDFDGDRSTDSTEADPVHTYHVPYEGIVRLQVRDSADCPQTVDKSITVTGPDLRYQDYVGLVEVTGNGNGALDPGETWEFTVEMRNDGNEPAVGAEADLRVGAATPGPVSILTGSAAYGDIAVGATAAGQPAYRFRIGQDFPCGEEIVFDLVSIRSSDPANVYPDEEGVIRLLVGGAGPAQTFFSDGFETDTGWSFQGGGEWEIGPPQGLGGGTAPPGGDPPSPDPDAAFEGANVLGNDLSGLGRWPGNYEALVDSTATSPPIDASGAASVELRFERWLTVAPGDTASVEVSADGQTWVPIFSASDGNDDGAWVLPAYDVSQWADGNPSFRFRFHLVTDGGLMWSGWNVDDVELRGVLRTSCEPFSVPSPGSAEGVTVARTPAGDLELSWQADCGGGTAYGLYRGDLRAGIGSAAPEPGLCSVSGTSAVLPAGPNPADFFLVVPNDGGFEGSFGPDSSGTERPHPDSACYPPDRVDSCAR